MIAILIILGVIIYASIGGFAYGTFHKAFEGDHRCKRPGVYCYSDHETPAFFTAVLWPAAVPFVLASRKGEGKSLSRDEKRRQREIEEARHQKELARIRMEEDALLTHQLQALERGRK